MVDSVLLADIRSQLSALTAEPDSISASTYDTAMVLRFAPPDPFWPAFEWLLAQQGADGGWGDADATELSRTVPTLAAILALRQRGRRRDAQQAVERGVAWLRRTVGVWTEPLPDDLPVGVELLLHPLLQDAEVAELALNIAPYKPLLCLGERRRAKLAAVPVNQLVMTTAIHSFEALGLRSEQQFLCACNGVGCSPAGTAVWLSQALTEEGRDVAVAFLERAATATGLGIPGVVPTAFPITRFVQAYTLHTLAQVGLLRHPALADLVAPHLDDLAAVVAAGIGCNDGFPPDGDDTAAALGALIADERPVDIAPLRRFMLADHFASYVGELQKSVITTARAAQVVAAAGGDTTPFRRWIAERQQSDGRWTSDKWNGHWLYTTWQAILALRDDAAHLPRLAHAERAIVDHQFPDGGWGVGVSTIEATAYGVLALAALPRLTSAGVGAIGRGRHVLQRLYRPFEPGTERHWLAKDRYDPRRLSRVIVLAALATTERHR